MKETSYKNVPVDVLRFELENSKANLKIAEQSLDVVNEQIPYVVPMKRAFMESHGGEDFDVANLSYDDTMRWIRISDTADCLLADKSRLEEEIRHEANAIDTYTAAIKKVVLKGREAK